MSHANPEATASDMRTLLVTVASLDHGGNCITQSVGFFLVWHQVPTLPFLWTTTQCDDGLARRPAVTVSPRGSSQRLASRFDRPGRLAPPSAWYLQTSLTTLPPHPNREKAVLFCLMFKTSLEFSEALVDGTVVLIRVRELAKQASSSRVSRSTYLATNTWSTACKNYVDSWSSSHMSSP